MPQSPTLLKPVAGSSTDGPITMSLAVPNFATAITVLFRTTTGYLKYNHPSYPSGFVKGGGSPNGLYATTDSDFNPPTQTVTLQSCDADGNPKGRITELRYSSGFLTAINLSQARGLVTLDIQNAALGTSGIDVSSNPSLDSLTVRNCQLTTLTLTNAKLAYVNASANALTSCNLSSLPLLYSLDLADNPSLTSVTLPPGNILQTLNLAFCPVLTGTLNLSGRTAIVNVGIMYTGFSAINVSGCTGLVDFNCEGNGLISTLDFTGCTALSSVRTTNCTDLENLIFTGCSSLSAVYADGCGSLTTLTLPASAPLYYLIIANTGISALSLTSSNGASLNTLDASETQIASLNLNACANLKSLNLNLCPLTSLRAVGVVFDGGKKKKGNINGQYCDISQCQLNAAALDQFYTDLGATTAGTGFLSVDNNPGITSDNPGIATAKGYVVFGT